MMAGPATAAMVSCNARLVMNDGNLFITARPAARSSLEVSAGSCSSGSSTRVVSLGSVLKKNETKKITSSIEYSRSWNGKSRSQGNVVVRASLRGEGGERVRDQLASEKEVAVELPNVVAYVDKSVLESFLDNASNESSIETRAAVGDDQLAAEDDADSGILQELGRSVEDTASVSLETREEGSQRGGDSAPDGPYFKDQELKGSVLDVASHAAVDKKGEVDAEAERDAEAIAEKFGGSKALTQANIEELAEVAPTLESQRASAGLETGSGQGLDQKGAKRPTIEELVKNVREGIGSRRPSIEDTSKKIASEVRQRVENLQGGIDGVVEAGEYAREGLDVAKEGLDKRIRVLNIAAEEARETGTKAADIAAKGWEALAKRTEDLVNQLQKTTTETQQSLNKNAQVAKEQIDKNMAEAHKKVGETRENIDDVQSDLEQNLTEIQKVIKQKVGEAQATYSNLMEEAQKAMEQSKEEISGSFTDSAAVSKMSQSYEHEVGNKQLELSGKEEEEDAARASLTQNTDPVEADRDDEWGGK